MSCTEETPCLAPMLRWVHSKTCQARTARPPRTPPTYAEALALVIQCARVCAMDGATRPDRWRLDDALRAFDRAAKKRAEEAERLLSEAYGSLAEARRLNEECARKAGITFIGRPQNTGPERIAQAPSALPGDSEGETR